MEALNQIRTQLLTWNYDGLLAHANVKSNAVVADWSRLQRIASFRNALVHDLTNAQNAVSRFQTASVQSVWTLNFTGETRQEYWEEQLQQLEQEVAFAGVRLDQYRFRVAFARARGNAYEAYHVLLAAFQNALAQKLSQIRRHLKTVCEIISLLLGSESRCFSLRNKISSQRRWYLRHGSHPTEQYFESIEGCFGRGCVAAFSY